MKTLHCIIYFLCFLFVAFSGLYIAIVNEPLFGSNLLITLISAIVAVIGTGYISAITHVYYFQKIMFLESGKHIDNKISFAPYLILSISMLFSLVVMFFLMTRYTEWRFYAFAHSVLLCTMSFSYSFSNFLTVYYINKIMDCTKKNIIDGSMAVSFPQNTDSNTGT